MADGIRIYIKEKGGNKVHLRNLPTSLDSLFTHTGIQLNQLAYRVTDKMVEYLEPRKRPKNYPGTDRLGKALKNSVKIEKIGKNEYRILIGNKSYLNQVAPYWRVINYGGSPWLGGGSIKTGQKFPLFGFFDGGRPPVKGGGGEPWYGVGGYVKGQGYGTPFMMKPKHPIEGKRYINKAIDWLNREWHYLTLQIPRWIVMSQNPKIGFKYEKIGEMARERLGIKTR